MHFGISKITILFCWHALPYTCRDCICRDCTHRDIWCMQRLSDAEIVHMQRLCIYINCSYADTMHYALCTSYCLDSKLCGEWSNLEKNIISRLVWKTHKRNIPNYRFLFILIVYKWGFIFPAFGVMMISKSGFCPNCVYSGR